jgi:hypothetical protein
MIAAAKRGGGRRGFAALAMAVVAAAITAAAPLPASGDLGRASAQDTHELAAAADETIAAPSAWHQREVDAPSCGGPGQQACPLQGWMRRNIGAPLASNNQAALADGLERASRLAPDPSWKSWSEIARTGAAAARRGDLAGARKACTACHDAWRAEYRAKHRARPVPF